MAEDGFTPEQLAEQIRQLKIEDILLSTVTTLGQLAYVKLDGGELDQARLAIDAIAALLAGARGAASTSRCMRDFKQLLANVRLRLRVSRRRLRRPGRGAGPGRRRRDNRRLRPGPIE